VVSDQFLPLSPDTSRSQWSCHTQFFRNKARALVGGDAVPAVVLRKLFGLTSAVAQLAVG
jgi:hypothetical protein